mgnify:CR=1 FL=1
MNRYMEFIIKLRSLQEQEHTDWKSIFGEFWAYAKHNIHWNRKEKLWEGEAFNAFNYSVIYVLSDEKVKEQIKNYISKVEESGVDFLKEME